MEFYYVGDSMKNIIISKDEKLCAEIVKYARIKNKNVFQVDCDYLPDKEAGGEVILCGFQIIDTQNHSYLELVAINGYKCNTNIYDVMLANKSCVIKKCQELNECSVRLLDTIRDKIGWRIDGTVGKSLEMLGCVFDDFNPDMFGALNEIELDGKKYRVYEMAKHPESVVVYTPSGDIALRVAEQYEETVIAPSYAEYGGFNLEDPSERETYEFLKAPHTYSVKINNWKRLQ